MSTSFPRAASLFALFACVVALDAPAAAQAQPAQRREAAPVIASPAPSPSPSATTQADNQDLSITANVTARELRFEVVPDPTVEFPGQPRRDTVWEAERTNLPAQIQPGVTYRDIGIRLKITSVFADIERIVAEALGEIPPSDGNAPPTTEPTPNPPPPQIDDAPRASMNATQTYAAPQAASSTQPPRASPASRASSSAQTNQARKKRSHAQARRERH
jgi:hypothetical protein